MAYVKKYAYAMQRNDYEDMFTSTGFEDGLRLFSLAFPYVISRNGEEYVIGNGKDVNYKPDDVEWQQFYELCKSCRGGVEVVSFGDFDEPTEEYFNEDSPYFDEEIHGMISLKISFELPKEGGLNA